MEAIETRICLMSLMEDTDVRICLMSLMEAIEARICLMSLMEDTEVSIECLEHDKNLSLFSGNKIDIKLSKTIIAIHLLTVHYYVNGNNCF
jgi:hypothetical protein